MLASHLVRAVLALLMGVALAAPLVLWTQPKAAYTAQDLRQNLARHLAARHHIQVQPEHIVLPGTGEPGGLGLRPREAFFVGRELEQKHTDVFFAHVVLSKKGIPVHASPAFSLARTVAADERELTYDGRRYLAFASDVENRTTVVTILDLRGLSGREAIGFTRTQRLQQSLTNWQETGLWRGLDRVEIRLNLPRRALLGWDRGKLRIQEVSGRWEALVDPGQARVLFGPVRARRVQVGRRAFLAWAVDTVRSLSFVGPERISWLEDRFYGLVDRARRLSGSTVTASEIQNEMDLPVVSGPPHSSIQGWPPEPLRPLIRPPLKREGRWVEVVGPFVRRQEGMPAYFAMTFLRPDAERPFCRAYFVAWDPRRVDLHMVPGTREPASATGIRGSGTIPRQPQVLRRLLAAFNGGFQSIHGDFGMAVEGKLYTPAKPWAATVARLADGRTGFGTWDGNASFEQVPKWIHSFRQNLTPMVDHGQFNPWKRGSWGGGTGYLTGSGPTAHIIRSGLCLHKSGLVMFVMGDPVDGPILGRIMQKAGCDYGLELDINKGHVGFEFINMRAPNERPPAGARSFREKRYFSKKGKFPGLRGFSYFMREVVRGTGNPSPRWIGIEARDFFYLLARDFLPDADLAPRGGEKNEGRWTWATLPGAALAFPHVMSRTFLALARPDGAAGRVHLLSLDLRWLQATLCMPRQNESCLARARSKSALAVLPLGDFDQARALLADAEAVRGQQGAGSFLVLAPRSLGGPLFPGQEERPVKKPGSISIQAAAEKTDGPAPPGHKKQITESAGPAVVVRAALCAGPQGRLLYAAGLDASPLQLQSALAHAGCTGCVQLGPVEPLVLVGDKGPTTFLGEILPPRASQPSLLLSRSTISWGARIFEHVKPQPRSVWTAVQPEATRGTALRRANKTLKVLGLPPIKRLERLCRPPYIGIKELRKFHWKDPITGAQTCPDLPGKKVPGSTPATKAGKIRPHAGDKTRTPATRAGKIKGIRGKTTRGKRSLYRAKKQGGIPKGSRRTPTGSDLSAPK